MGYYTIVPVPTESPQYEFWFPHLDTLVRVEETDGGVTVRATRDSFNDQRKLAFIRELAAEGFISDEYCWFSMAAQGSFGRGVRWVVDHSWLELNVRHMEQTQRVVLGFLLPATLAWLFLLCWIVPGPTHKPLPSEQHPRLTSFPYR